MGKAGIILGIIGILIGSVGLGFGFITLIDQSQVNIWNDYEPDYFTAPDLSYETIPDLYVIVDLRSSVQLYVTFSASTKILPDPVSFADIFFYIMIDGTRLENPYTRVGPYRGTSTYDYHSVTLQYFNASFPAGRHNISIAFWSETVGNVIRECLLTVQSYPI